MEDEKRWIFDGYNYDQWAYRVTVLLEEKGLMECIERNIEEEEYFAEADGDTPEVKAEKKRILEQRRNDDRKFKSLIIHRIADSHLEFVTVRETAKERWESLRNNFQRRGLANRLFYRRRLGMMKLKNGVRSNLKPEEQAVSLENLVGPREKERTSAVPRTLRMLLLVNRILLELRRSQVIRSINSCIRERSTIW